MTAYAWLECVVIAALVAWSAWTLLGRLLPNVRNRLLRTLGKAPRTPSAGCDSGCSACSGCSTAASPPARKSADAPVRFDALR